MIALAMLLTVAGDPFDHLDHRDPLVRQSAQSALLKECCRRGEEGLRLLDRRVLDPETRRRLRAVRRRLAEVLSLETLLAPFARADLAGGLFVRYLRSDGYSYGWTMPGREILDWGLTDHPAVALARSHFRAVCLRYLRGELHAPKGVDEAVFACNLAYRALNSDQGALARSLVAHARASRELLGFRSRDDEPDFRAHVRTGLGRVLGERATFAARRSVPRQQLLELWKRARLADPDSALARDMHLGLQQLVADDRAGEMEVASWRGAPRSLRVRNRMDRLRDSKTSCWSERAGVVLDSRCRAIIELGWAAIPALILRLEDTRPTRGIVREDGRHRPMTHGELIRELLRRITARRLETVRQGLAWWRDASELGPERYYLNMMLGSTSIAERRLAASALLRHDSSENRDAVLFLAGREIGSNRGAILSLLDGRLDGSHEQILRPFLDGGGWQTRLAAARLLWGACRADYGMRRVAVDLSRDTVDFWYARRAATPLARMPQAFAGAVLAKLLRSRDRSIRLIVRAEVWPSRHADVRDALLETLADRTPTGYVREDIGVLRVCDLAAGTVAKIIRYPRRFRLTRDFAGRDVMIARLLSWAEAGVAR